MFSSRHAGGADICPNHAGRPHFAKTSGSFPKSRTGPAERERSCPKRCRNVARHASRKVAQGEPGELRSRPRVAPQLSKRCSGRRDPASTRLTLSDLSHLFFQFGPASDQTRTKLAYVGHVLVDWGQLLLGIGQQIAGVGRIAVDQTGATSGQTRQNMAEVSQNSSTVDRLLSQGTSLGHLFGSVWAASKLLPDSPGPTFRAAQRVRFRPRVGEARADSFGPCCAKRGLEWVEFGPKLADIGPTSADSPTNTTLTPNIGRSVTSPHILGHVGQNSADVRQVWRSKLAKHRRSRVNSLPTGRWPTHCQLRGSWANSGEISLGSTSERHPSGARAFRGDAHAQPMQEVSDALGDANDTCECCICLDACRPGEPSLHAPCEHVFHQALRGATLSGGCACVHGWVGAGVQTVLYVLGGRALGIHLVVALLLCRLPFVALAGVVCVSVPCRCAHRFKKSAWLSGCMIVCSVGSAAYATCHAFFVRRFPVRFVGRCRS